MVYVAERELLSRGQLKANDVLGVVAGTRQSAGSTNFMRLHTVTPAEVVKAARPEKVAQAASAPKSEKKRGKNR
jgi:hypothetical protein